MKHGTLHNNPIYFSALFEPGSPSPVLSLVQRSAQVQHLSAGVHQPLGRCPEIQIPDHVSWNMTKYVILQGYFYRMVVMKKLLFGFFFWEGLGSKHPGSVNVQYVKD